MKTAEEILSNTDGTFVLASNLRLYNAVIKAMDEYAMQYKTALKELEKEASDLMGFCIDRKYLDDEDLTDGQKLFETAINNSRNLLKLNI